MRTIKRRITSIIGETFKGRILPSGWGGDMRELTFQIIDKVKQPSPLGASYDMYVILIESENAEYNGKVANINIVQLDGCEIVD